jgi:hypothetical protein
MVKIISDQLVKQDNDSRQRLYRLKKVLDPLEEENQSSRINDLEILNDKAPTDIDTLRESHKIELAALWTDYNEEMKRKIEIYEQRFAEQEIPRMKYLAKLKDSKEKRQTESANKDK